ncbi:probable polygalacturonase At1g80170 [Papaver somniferum]|uniref:probable polygalacturonase At1g80170 n=1 Tax=Papaver somniferum TaxID=3469 RepID=UPI000E6F5D52|nr:probable polygalacturonase At1g80170 [Papaver somniferum]
MWLMFVTREKELELIFWDEMPDNSPLWSTFYVQGGNGYAKDSYFKNLNVDTVSNPIITDQYYYAVAGAFALQGGNGYAKDWYFKNLNVYTVSNPIITDQYYYAVAGACALQNVTYEHFTGTSATQASVVVNCSPAILCTDLTFNTILLSPAKWGEIVKSVCINAHGERAGLLHPKIPCLLN